MPNLLQLVPVVQMHKVKHVPPHGLLHRACGECAAIGIDVQAAVAFVEFEHANRCGSQQHAQMLLLEAQLDVLLMQFGGALSNLLNQPLVIAFEQAVGPYAITDIGCRSPVACTGADLVLQGNAADADPPWRLAVAVQCQLHATEGLARCACRCELQQAGLQHRLQPGAPGGSRSGVNFFGNFADMKPPLAIGFP